MAAYVLALRAGQGGETYNVCSGKAVAMSDILDVLSRASSVPLGIIIEKDRFRESEIRSQRGDPERLHELTAWKPAISVERSLYDLVEKHRAGR